MKRTTSIVLLTVLMIPGGCKKITEVLTTRIDAVLSISLPVTITASSTEPAGTFLATGTFDPLADEELAMYEDIREFELTGLTGTASELIANAALKEVKLTVSAASLSAQWNFANLPFTNGIVITFDNTGSQWAIVNEMLNARTPVTVTFSGKSTQTGVSFNFLVKFKTVVSVKKS
jgi:hypothetical protein